MEIGGYIAYKPPSHSPGRSTHKLLLFILSLMQLRDWILLAGLPLPLTPSPFLPRIISIRLLLHYSAVEPSITTRCAHQPGGRWPRNTGPSLVEASRSYGETIARFYRCWARIFARNLLPSMLMMIQNHLQLFFNAAKPLNIIFIPVIASFPNSKFVLIAPWNFSRH